MRIIIFILSLIFCSQSFAASIWHVEGPQEFYLFGTIHLLKPESYPLPEVYKRTLEQCNTLWLEADSDELSDAETLQSIQQALFLPAGQSLKQVVSASAFKQLEALASQANVSLNLLAGLKPWAAVNELTRVIFEQHGFTSEGLDLHLQGYAKEHNIPVKAFETFAWQLNMFDELYLAVGDDFIEFSTTDMDNVDQLVSNMYNQWSAGNYQDMYQDALFDEHPVVETKLLEQRNTKWMQALLAIDGKDTQCVAVGTLHMAAGHGLVNQFTKAGYRVTQVTN